VAEWPCCHDPLRFSPLSLRFVPPPIHSSRPSPSLKKIKNSLSPNSDGGSNGNPSALGSVGLPRALIRFPSASSLACGWLVSPVNSVASVGLGRALVSLRLVGLVQTLGWLRSVGVSPTLSLVGRFGPRNLLASFGRHVPSTRVACSVCPLGLGRLGRSGPRKLSALS
jgi:hypothetical protein